MAKKKELKKTKRKVFKRTGTKRKSNNKRIIFKKKNKPRNKSQKARIARKKLKRLLKSPDFFVLAPHPVFYKRPPKFVRDKISKK